MGTYIAGGGNGLSIDQYTAIRGFGAICEQECKLLLLLPGGERRQRRARGSAFDNLFSEDTPPSIIYFNETRPCLVWTQAPARDLN
jgi:hypothetical protein